MYSLHPIRYALCCVSLYNFSVTFYSSSWNQGLPTFFMVASLAVWQIIWYPPQPMNSSWKIWVKSATKLTITKHNIKKIMCVIIHAYYRMYCTRLPNTKTWIIPTHEYATIKKMIYDICDIWVQSYFRSILATNYLYMALQAVTEMGTSLIMHDSRLGPYNTAITRTGFGYFVHPRE